MAVAYLDPAADLDHVSSPNRSAGLPAGSRVFLPSESAPRRQVDLLAIADGFAASAAGISELRQCTERSWVLLAVTDLFEAWAIGWPPGGAIELHDHGQSHGAVVVVDGALLETTIQPTEHRVALLSTHHLPTGSHRSFGRRYVHDLVNDSGEGAISVHVYGPRLTDMTYYRLDRSGTLVAERTEAVAPLGPFDTTGTYDPS